LKGQGLGIGGGCYGTSMAHADIASQQH
jgi:hypothetical protein